MHIMHTFIYIRICLWAAVMSCIAAKQLSVEQYQIAMFKNNQYADNKYYDSALNQLRNWRDLGYVQLHYFGNTIVCIIQHDRVIPDLLNTTLMTAHLTSIEDNLIFHAFGSNNANEDEIECTSTGYDDDPYMWYLGRINQPGSLTDNDSFIYNYTLHDNGMGVTAYIVDTGIRLNHSEFEGRAFHGHMSTKVSVEDGGIEDDLNGHGTSLASLIGGRTYGIAREIKLVSVKILDKDGNGWLSDAVEALEYIYNETILGGRDSVINLSFGVKGGESPALEELVQKLYNNNVTLVSAAGDDNHDGACWYIPGKYPEVNNIAATNRYDEFYSESNWGSCVSMMAPGVDVRVAGIKHDYDSTIGTGSSYAAALVTGAIGRILSNPTPEWKTDNPKQVFDKLLEHSTSDAIDIPESTTENIFLYVYCTDSDGVPVDPVDPDTTSNIGAIVGGSIAICAVLAVLFGGLYYFHGRYKTKKDIT